jgi:hypothetical protein
MKKPVCKLPLSLKITLFVLFSFASLLYASNNYAQRTMLNISSQTRTVSEVLTEIEKQTDFTFFYNNKQVDLKRKVTLNVKNENVFSVLKKLFSGTNTTYKVLDKNIILSEKSAISSATKEVAIVQQVGRSVKGVVVDDKGEPVIGATVMVKGSTNGTITDFDGNFILNDVRRIFTQKACDAVKIEREVQLLWMERQALKKSSEQNRSNGIAFANQICKEYRREGRFFDEILDGAKQRR